MRNGTRILLYRGFICLLFIVLIYYLSIRELFQNENKDSKRRLALIIRGEAFRKGGQGNRDDGMSESYDEQKAACNTHLELIHKIEQQGYEVDVYINSYNTQYNNEILGWYGKYVKDYRFHEQKLANQMELIKNAIEMIHDKLNTYDTLLIIRIDIYLKERFIKEYNADNNTVQIPFVLWSLNYKTPKGNPMLTDIIIHFPKIHYDKLYARYSGEVHDHDFLDIVPLEYEKEYSLMTRNFHDADSAKDFNPYYRMIGRTENMNWYDGSLKEFPKDFI